MEKLRLETPLKPGEPSSAFRTEFASLSLHGSDRVRLLKFPSTAIAVVRNTIRTRWSKGLQDERDHAGAVEFKLRGRPWVGKFADAVRARRFMHCVFEALSSYGWVLCVATDISRLSTDKSTLLFRHQHPAPAPCEWMSIAFSQSDRLRFIDGPRDLIEASLQALARFVRSHEPHREAGVYEFKLQDEPWTASGSETMEAQRLLLMLIEVLETHGFTIYASIDQKNGAGGGQTDNDTWHCCRARGWVVGMPVFHGR